MNALKIVFWELANYMKMFRNLFLILFVFLGGILTAQTDYSSQLAEEVEGLSKAYQLDQEQSNSLTRVLTRKYEMLKGIETHKENDFQKFLALRRSIYKGTLGSIKLILTDEQIPLYNEEATRQRRVNSARVKELRAQGAGKDQLIDAGLGIEW